MDRMRNFGFLIKDIGRLYTKLFEQQASHLSVTLPQCKALVLISRNEGISQIRLAELSGIKPMSLVRILDRMEADDWIERRAHPADRRARQLYLKKKAQPIMEQVWKTSDAVRAQALTRFKAEERKLLINLLERSHTNLLAANPNEPPIAKTSAPPLSSKKKLTAKTTRHGAAAKTTNLRLRPSKPRRNKPLKNRAKYAA